MKKKPKQITMKSPDGLHADTIHFKDKDPYRWMLYLGISMMVFALSGLIAIVIYLLMLKL